MTKKIAITGGIGSGKSFVTKILKEMGFPVFSCDKIYAEVVNSHSYIENVCKYFPSAVREGKIDKKRLSDIVFQDDNARKTLNGIAHPLIMDQLFKQMNTCTDTLAFAEVPLLFEGGFENLFDGVIVVLREKQERIKAVQERDELREEEVLARMNAQVDYDSEETREKLKNKNVYLLINDKDKQALKRSVDDLLERIEKRES